MILASSLLIREKKTTPTTSIMNAKYLSAVLLPLISPYPTVVIVETVK